MTSNPSISVVIPCFNAGEWLQETIQSVLAQTASAFEVLVVDDGSTDDSASLAESFGQPVRVIRQPNQGESVARNRGIEEAVGDWIAFVDADDVWLPTKLAEQVNALARSPEDVACVHTGFYLFGGRNFKPAVPAWSQKREFTFRDLILKPIVNTSTAMVRRENSLRFPTWTRAGEDMIYFAELAERGSLVYLPDHLVGYRCHEKQQHVTVTHLKAHHQSRLQAVQRHGESGTLEVRKLELEMQQQLLKPLRRLRRDRQWAQYWELRQFLSEMDWRGDRPTALDDRVYPRFMYRIKDLVS